MPRKDWLWIRPCQPASAAPGKAAPKALAAFLAFALAAGIAGPGAAAKTACWRGWAYWVDSTTRAYKSSELLVVTKGLPQWAAGGSVWLHHLDRETGQIDGSAPAIRAKPLNPRVYYRGRSNYVDGIASVEGSADNLIFGLNEVGANSSNLSATQEFNRWACGLQGASD